MYSKQVIRKAKWLLDNGKVKLDAKAQGIYFTVSGNGKDHDVIIYEGKNSCTCQYWVYRQENCSHILACLYYIKRKTLWAVGKNGNGEIPPEAGNNK